VAVAWSLAFAWAFHLHLPPWIPASLAMTVWAIYAGDRLLDAYTALRKGSLRRLRDRHRFHWRHRVIFLPLGLCAAMVAAGIILALMPPIALERNSVLAAATLAYFTGVHSPRRPLTREPNGLRAGIFTRMPSSELMVGVLFTAGCVLPVFARAAKADFLPLLGLALYFALLACLNCAAIHRWESEKKAVQAPNILISAMVLNTSGLLAAILLSDHQTRAAALMTAGTVSALLLALLNRLRNRLTPLALRAGADLVLLTPLVLLVR